jgi:hypothetical protein
MKKCPLVFNSDLGSAATGDLAAVTCLCVRCGVT